MSFLDLFRKKSKYNVKPKHNIPREVYGIPSPSKFDVKPEDNIEETNALFNIHSDGIKWLHTGDLGYIDEDGFLFLSGRMKRMLILGDGGIKYKVFPNVIEEVICKVEEVQTACVVSIDINGNSVAKAYVVLKTTTEEKQRIEHKIKMRCEMELPEYMRPERYTYLEQLPLTSVGKIDYKVLEKM